MKYQARRPSFLAAAASFLSPVISIVDESPIDDEKYPDLTLRI
jgi:hypothetical protein